MVVIELRTPLRSQQSIALLLDVARLAAGTYYVEVSSFRGGSRGFYDLSINLAP
jgi:hypothetical protein